MFSAHLRQANHSHLHAISLPRSHRPPHVPLQRLLPAPECHEFQVAGASAAGDLLEVVEGVGEEDDVSLQDGRAVLPAQLGEVLEATLVHQVPQEVSLLARVTPCQLGSRLLLLEPILVFLDELSDDPTLEEGTVEPADRCRAQPGVSDGKEPGNQGFTIEVLGIRVVKVENLYESGAALPGDNR